MRRAVLFFPLGLTLGLAARGPVKLRSDANRAVIQYDSHDATLADATAVARASCAQYGKRASFSELTGDGRCNALFECLPQMAQAPRAMP